MDNVPVFERGTDGLLRQISDDRAGREKISRRWHHVQMLVEVLFTPEEEEARSLEETAAVAEPKPTLEGKLAQLGISVDELRDEILGVKK